MTKIINWKTKKVIIEDPNLSLRELVEKAVKKGVSLAYADLRGVDCKGVDFKGAYLEYANFENVKLSKNQVEYLLKSTYMIYI